MSGSHPAGCVPLQILETCLYVADLERARAFYEQVLGLTMVSQQPGRHVFFRCGRQMLLLFEPQASAEPADVPSHGSHGPMHLAFGVAAKELEAWRQRLSDHQVAIEKVVQWEPGQSIYFRDPDGNSLEITSPEIWGI